MKKVLTVLGLMVTLGFSAPIDGYMQSLANEAKKADPSFKGFDAVSGKQIFTSEHIGKKGQNISCASCHTNDLKQAGKNTFTAKVIDPLSPKANKEKKRPNIWNNGAPGGCPTWSLNAVAMYSPQSQKLIVGSTVKV